jgi:PPM family protein phosphatase
MPSTHQASLIPTLATTGDYPIQGGRPVSPPRFRVEFGALTDAGKVRSNNEDQLLVARLSRSMTVCQSSLPGTAASPPRSEEQAYLMVVADGMGGAAAGERASALAVQSIERSLTNPLLRLDGRNDEAIFSALRDGLEDADRVVIAQSRADKTLRGMGTTLTMAYSVDGDLYLAHVGDSRAYLYHDGTLKQLTSDHTLVQVLVNGGALSPEDVKKHPQRNVVTNIVGGPRAGVFAETHKVTLADGDVLLLCSDGLSEPVEDARIAEILAAESRPQEACAKLVNLALERGAPDNVTVIVARYQMGD